MMAKPYLPKGSKTYRIHPRVPVEYRGVAGASHVTRSLGTGDLREAKRRVPALMQKLIQGWDAQLRNAAAGTDPSAEAETRITAKAGFHFDSIAHACAYFEERAAVIEATKRREAADRIARDPEAFWRGEVVRLPNEPLIDHPMASAGIAFKRLAASRRQVLAGQMAMGDLSGIQPLVRHAFNPPHSEDTAFVHAMARTLMRFQERIAQDDTGIDWFMDEVDGFYAAAPSGQQSTVPADRMAASGGPKLSSVCEAFVQERGASLSPERAGTIRAAVRDLIEVTSDKAVPEYSRNDANAFKAVLLALPGNWNKRKGLREHGIVEASQVAAQMKLPRQAAGTIRKKWSALHGLFDYASLKHEGVRNPFVAKALAVKDGRAANEKGDTFRQDELKTLLASLTIESPSHLYWLTHLSLYSGARLNELCQLSKAHILRHGDLNFIRLSGDLRLIEKSCVRSIPIHPALVELGFLDYVQASSDVLFPGLPSHQSGRLSNGPSRAFHAALDGHRHQAA